MPNNQKDEVSADYSMPTPPLRREESYLLFFLALFIKFSHPLPCIFLDTFAVRHRFRVRRNFGGGPFSVVPNGECRNERRDTELGRVGNWEIGKLENRGIGKLER